MPIGIPAAIMLAGGMGAAGGIASGIIGADAAGDANSANINAQKYQTKLNMLWNLVSRGAPMSMALSAMGLKPQGTATVWVNTRTGRTSTRAPNDHGTGEWTQKEIATGDVPANLWGAESTNLPYYMGDFEKRAGLRAVDVWNQTAPLTTEQYTETIKPMQPAVTAASQNVNDILSGEYQKQREAALGGVLRARTSGAESAVAARNEALARANQTIANVMRGKGFGADSFATQRLLAEEGIKSAAEASGLRTAAELANAADILKSVQTGQEEKKGAMQLPFTMGANLIDWRNMPANALLTQEQRRMGVTTPFRLPGSLNVNIPEPFKQEAIPSAGAIAAQGVGNFATDVGNLYLMKQLYPNLFRTTTPPPTTPQYEYGSSNIDPSLAWVGPN